MSRAASQVTRNSPTITNPAVLMLNRDIKPQKAGGAAESVDLLRQQAQGLDPRPMTKQIATDSPVMARL